MRLGPSRRSNTSKPGCHAPLWRALPRSLEPSAPMLKTLTPLLQWFTPLTASSSFTRCPFCLLYVHSVPQAARRLHALQSSRLSSMSSVLHPLYLPSPPILLALCLCVALHSCSICVSSSVINPAALLLVCVCVRVCVGGGGACVYRFQQNVQVCSCEKKKCA